MPIGLESHQELLERLTPKEIAISYSRPERRSLIIIFTPRSGSTWFGDLLASTNAFGVPDEHVLHENLAKNIKYCARTELDYLNAFEHTTSSGDGVFSMQISWGDIERFSTIDFFEHYKNAKFVVLRRSNIIAQSVSLYFAVSTGTFHQKNEEIISNTLREDAFVSIKDWCHHILSYEFKTEARLATLGIKPIRILYEEITANPATCIDRLLVALNIKDSQKATSQFKQVQRGEKYHQIYEKFIETESDFIKKIYALRPPLYL